MKSPQQIDNSDNVPAQKQGGESAKRWQRLPEQRPDAILDSALLLFRAKGFSSTRIEDIAAGAGLSKGAVYTYFSGKEAMLQALVERAVLPLAQNIEDLAANATKMQVIPTLSAIVALAATKLGDPKIAAVPLMIVAEAGKFPNLAQFYRENVLERVMAAFSLLLQNGMDEGIFRSNLNPEHAVRTLMGGMFFQLVWTNVFAREPFNPKQVEKLMQEHLAIFLTGVTIR
ncbi:MAG: TetR family transcriptional regulator [Robiginitomaculum sp.]|nr:MAG: TetR family transcriptional regulator [Robiginitomaculum sp.]